MSDADIDVLQHGLLHRNHASRGEPKAEFGPHRPRPEMLAELADGRNRLACLCPALPVLVPPWNHIDMGLASALPAIGMTGLSTIWPRPPAPLGLTVVNTHIDIMSWITRRFAGEEATLAAAVGHLSGRRAGTADPDEPTGLLTHHLAHDPPAWAFIRRFGAETASHPAVRWLSARTLFRSTR
jgi:hypothetical protein